MTVSEGHVLFVAAADAYAEDRAGVRAPLGGVRLVLTPASPISGGVVASTGEPPVPGVRVTARRDLLKFDGAAEREVSGDTTKSATFASTYASDWTQGGFDPTCAA
jgi:hypothetical protein